MRTRAAASVWRWCYGLPPLRGGKSSSTTSAATTVLRASSRARAADLAGPVRTIAKALRLAGAGDVIVLAKTNAPYRESVSLVGSRHSGTAKEPFMIRGNGAILDGSAPVPAKAWESYKGAIFRFRPPQSGYQQLFLDGRPAVQVPVGRADLCPSEPPELKPRQWCLLGAYIYFCVEQTKLPADYQLTYARQQTGITLLSRRLRDDCRPYGPGFSVGRDQSVQHGPAGVAAWTSRCRDNGRSGVAVGGASSVAIEGSRLGGNGHAQLLTLPYSETHLHNTESFATRRRRGSIRAAASIATPSSLKAGATNSARPPKGSRSHDARRR